NTIDYITQDGDVVYRRQCFKNLEMDMDRPPSVTLPVSEVEGLQKGQMAAVVQDSLDPQNSTLIFGCWDKGEGKKICSRVEEILFQ
ncbi:MAG: hypothetical protein JRG91_14585, partial [Deltaproteobacteria bacterium]|nr:hypothetical protein [Deltaproteobacteria bacterium]